MSEFSGHWTTDAVSPVGHQVASYTQATNGTLQKIMAACSAFEGIAPNYLNALAGTVTAVNTVAINTGGAMVDGKAYENNASLDVNIPSAGAGSTRIDRIVLRANWAGFIVSVTRIAGVDSGSPTAPAITQTPGTTYDIMLYQALVDAAGAVTLTDERVMAGMVAGRQGLGPTDWEGTGADNFKVPNVKIQCGAALATAGGGVAVTFPVPFSYAPLVFTQVPAVNITGAAGGIGASGFTVYAINNTSNVTVDAAVQWIAIGPVA